MTVVLMQYCGPSLDRRLQAARCVQVAHAPVPVMRIQGIVPLPIGTEIELYPDVNATVVGVRLLAGSEHVPVALCLEVDVLEADWEEQEDPDLPPSVGNGPLTLRNEGRRKRELSGQQ